MSQERVDKAREKNVGVTLTDLDDTAIGIDAAPLFAGHAPRRRQYSPFNKRKRIVGSQDWGAH